MKRFLLILLATGLSFTGTKTLKAQDGTNPLKYSSMAQAFSSENTNGDANNGLLPATAMENGFGSFLDNPASAALITTSYFNFGYNSNITDQDNSYLGNIQAGENRLGRIGNIGLVYSVPTTQGSLVIGGGYSQNSTINRIAVGSAFNEQSTITDEFQEPSSDYYNIAFDTYAIDFYSDDSDDLESIFRIGFDPASYPGITQSTEVTQFGQIGEFSLFGASEISKNLYAGASLGITFGNYSYRRNLLEEDTQNIYDGDFIEGTDISYIQLKDDINSQIAGLTARFGLVYKVLPFLNIGSSITLPTRLIITEDYYSEIETGLDDNSSPFLGSYEGDFSYGVRKPGKLNLGLAIDDLNGFSLSGSVEMIDYTSTEIDLTRDSNIDFQEEAGLRSEEEDINNTIGQNYNLVTNIRIGSEYRTIRGTEFRAGFGYFPGKSKLYSADRTQFGAGIGAPLSRDIFFDFAVQYTMWDDRSILYDYYDRSTGVLENEFIDESINQISVIAGIKVRL